LSNLIGNAEKFTPRGGTVVVQVSSESGAVVMRVRDNGLGIAPDVLEHLFEPFVQAPQTMDRARGGLGLGLAMVKGLVELHGGSVTAFSDGSGHGADLTIRLPQVPPPVDVAPASPAPPEQRARRVLVIDDNIDTADSMRDGLALSGHEVRVA